MGAGAKHSRERARQRALAAPAASAPIAPVVEIAEQRERRSLAGRDAPPATLRRWLPGTLTGDLSWADVVGIMLSAEQTGATETWARLTRRMYQDGRILAVRGTRLDPVASADFDVEAGGEDPIDAQAAKDVEQMLREIPELPRVLDGVLDAIFVGWSVSEVIWTPRGAWVWPEAIDTLEPHRFRFTETIEPYLYDDGRMAADPGANPQIRLMGRPLRENKYIVHMPRAIPDYAIASGLLRAVAKYWWAKWKCTQFWLAGAEIAGNPRAVGKYGARTGSEAVSDSVRDAMYQQLESLSATGIAVIGSESEIEITPPSAQGQGGVWSSLIDWADQGITLTVLGSDLNTAVGSTGGNRALGESQGAYTIDPRLKKDSDAMWSTIQRDLVRPFLEFNRWRYGGRMPAVPRIRSRFVEELEPKPTDRLIDVGGVSINELRKADGLPEWPAERGDVVARRTQSGGFGAFSAIAGGLNQADANTVHASGGAPAGGPFSGRPWDLVDRLSREAE